MAILLIAINVQSQDNLPSTLHYLDPYNPEYVKGEVLVKFKHEVKINESYKSSAVQTGIESLDQVLSQYAVTEMSKVFKVNEPKEPRFITTYEGETVEVPQLFNIYRITFETEKDAKMIADSLSMDSSVDFAEPNYLVFTMETYPDDPLYLDGSQWYIDEVDAPLAWDMTTGDTNQIVGVLDTGIDLDHPDLEGNLWTNWDEIPDNGVDDDANGYIDDRHGWDFVNNDNDPNDNNLHGTHVSGIIAGEGNNSIGITGIVWTARLMPLKILNCTGYGSSSNFAQAIEYASDNGAGIINMSLGNYAESSIVKNALLNAYADAILVAAAGNDSKKLVQEGVPSGNFFPACYDFVLGVMASNVDCELASFTNIDPSGPIEFWNNWGYNYELTAPGVNIMSTKKGGSYKKLNGTSMSCAVVSGICALYKSYHTSSTNEELWASLIQGSENGCVNAANTIGIDLDTLGPDLRFIEYTLIDTLSGCDGDGRADAGETVEIYLTVKNAGGWADSVWSKIRLVDINDSVYSQVIDSTSYIGDLSTWATLTGELSPLEIYIDSNVAHNRDIVFEYEIGCKNSLDKIINDLIIEVENGVELTGVVHDTLWLTADKLWLVSGSFKIAPDGVLIISPGTNLLANVKIVNDGVIVAHGTNDSIISIEGKQIIGTHPNQGNLDFINTHLKLSGEGESVKSQEGVFDNCKLYDFSCYHVFLYSDINFYDCIFENFNFGGDCFDPNSYLIERCTFVNISCGAILYGIDNLAKHCNFSNVTTIIESNPHWWPGLYKCNFLDEYSKNIIYALPGYTQYLQNQYWGTIDSGNISNKIYDFYEDALLSEVVFIPFLNKPSDSAHGCVWKVEINGIDPQDEILDPLGADTYQFDIYFNKCMDTAFTPLLTFGVIEPHLQTVVNDNASWSEDSSIWTAYHAIGIETGDGINSIRVSGAVDTAGFEIPVEDNRRFQFVIQAAGAASINFIATPGIGKVDLEWPPANTQDILGYNIYRYYNITDSTFSNPILINTELILDTLYADFDVIPDTTYHYMYTVLGTDMAESDYSKSVAATPFDAPNGDANGDMAVNVLDITSIVAYMLNQNPTPFLFDAADVNGDLAINVLDIIGVVGIMNGTKSAPLSKLISLSNQSAWISMKDEGISLESKGNLAALQFDIKGITPENLNMISTLEGFEFASVVEEDRIIGILFSFTGKLIPEGTFEIISFNKSTPDLNFTEAIGGDIEGQYVPVYYKEGTINNQFNKLNAFSSPNPFSGATQIHYELDEFSEVNIGIYNLSGKLIKAFQMPVQPKGVYSIMWKGNNNTGIGLNNGIYFCRIQSKSVIDGSNRQANIKLVLIR